MDFTKEQLSEVLCKHAERENGLQDLMEIMIESMMVAERREYLREDGLPGDKGNGFRIGHTYGQGRTLTFRIPRDRYGNFHPRILAVLRSQEEECERLAGTLYSKGLTQEQVGDVFNDIYGEHYSKASISRMLEYLRKDVQEWLSRSLEAYYPVLFIDCVHIKIHRKRSVDTEAFYVLLAVKGLEDVIAEVFPKTPLQHCTTHLKRNIISDVRIGDKREVAEDLKQVFRTGDRNYTVEKAWTEWQSFCDKWGRYYRAIKRRRDDCSYKLYFTYLNYDHRIQAMIYTTNWIERLQKDFLRVTRMRGAMPNEESVLLLMGKTAMDKKSYLRQVPRIDLDETLFPPEKAAPQPEYTTSGCYDPKLRELAEMARSASAVAEEKS